jgi:hypothetical protein
MLPIDAPQWAQNDPMPGLEQAGQGVGEFTVSAIRYNIIPSSLRYL